MTPELQEQLDYLKSRMQPPYTYGWWPQVKHRAAQLAREPEFAALPGLVEAEYERLKAAAMSSQPAGPQEP